MRVAIFGAAGGIGRRVVDQAIEARHTPALFVRDSSRLETRHAAYRVIEGSMEDARAVGDAVAGTDGVINALGPTTNEPHEIGTFEGFATALVMAMERHGARRLVSLSGGAVRVAGERKRPADRIATAVVRHFAGNVVLAKQREYEIFAASSLEWVCVRPPRVVEGPLTGRYRVGEISIGPRSRISQADLAHFLVSQLTDDRFLRRAPFISY